MLYSSEVVVEEMEEVPACCSRTVEAGKECRRCRRCEKGTNGLFRGQDMLIVVATIVGE